MKLDASSTERELNAVATQPALALQTSPRGAVDRRNDQTMSVDSSVWLLAIANGAGHIRAASNIARALEAAGNSTAEVIEISRYMTRSMRLTHITAYLWLVRRAPAVWAWIDRLQKRRPTTSPPWYYRRGCRALFARARVARPRALVATEVGCCEIAALIKRDLALRCPLIAVNPCYDADRAWVQPEVDLYCVATDELRAELIARGAAPSSVAAWGVPLDPRFDLNLARGEAKRRVCAQLNLAPELPLLLVAGGSEGLGLDEILDQALRHLPRAQFIVLAGRHARIKAACERLVGEQRWRVRVLGWTDDLWPLLRAADLALSKLGNFFDEALAAELPIVAPLPPPGSERVQHRLLNRWGVGCGVHTAREAALAAAQMLAAPTKLESARHACRRHRRMLAASSLAAWITAALARHTEGALSSQ